MEVSRETIDGLGALASLPAAEFDRVVALAASAAAGSAPDPAAAALDGLPARQAFSAATQVIAAASSHAADERDVRSVLDEGGLDEAQAGRFAAAAGGAREAVRAALARTSFDPARVEGVDWRMDYLLKSNALEKIKVPVYFVTLKTREPSGEPRDVQFTCSYQELQQLISKLRDGLKQVERILEAAGGQQR